MTFLRRSVLCGALAVPLMSGGGIARQSGRGLMHGYVAFDGVSYNEVSEGAIHAYIRLRNATGHATGGYTARTDKHGGYDFPAIGMGEYLLTITAPGYATYQTRLYIPSDFECRLAVMLRRQPAH